MKKKPVSHQEEDSIDLTDAMNPDWYFRDHESEMMNKTGNLRSPGHIKQVGFGKNKVNFIDVLASKGNSRRI